jgi:hypothetical protein
VSVDDPATDTEAWLPDVRLGSTNWIGGPGCFERLASVGRIPGPYFGHPFFTAVVCSREPV